MITTTNPVGFNADFGAFLNAPVSQCDIDLSNATLLECIAKKIEVKQRISPRFHKQYFTILRVLNLIQQEYNITLYPQKIGEVFYSFFIPYMVGKNYGASTIKTVIAQLKASLEWSSHYGAKISESYNIASVPTYSKKHISLTPDDVSRIYHFDIDSLDRRKQHKRTLIKVRDMFCLMCNCGLRYSDAKRLTGDHIENGTIHILQQKTQMYAHIDLASMCIHRDMTNEILLRYDNNAPIRIDNTEFDKQLHELMMYCRFNEEIKQEIILDGEITVETKAKHKLITSHSARRTFVVNNAIRGKSALEIMRATGHKTFSAFQKYLCYQ